MNLKTIAGGLAVAAQAIVVIAGVRALYMPLFTDAAGAALNSASYLALDTGVGALGCAAVILALKQLEK